ncbi:MAG: hypothetical protein KGQ95_09375 [Acidobacteria bacterium]|nr:hypothetical protein [Acidobacteriota bacterium]
MITDAHMHCPVALTKGYKGVPAGTEGVLIAVSDETAWVEFPFFVGDCPYVIVPADAVEPLGASGPRAA